MRKKTAACLIAILGIAAVVISAGCIGEKGKGEEKVKGAPLSVKIEKAVYVYSDLGKKVLDVKINFTNTGNKDVDLNQFNYYLCKYDPGFKAYQETGPVTELFCWAPTLGPGGTYEIPHLVKYVHPPETEEKYKFIMKKMPEKWGEESKKVLEIEFSVTPEDWDNPDLYRYGK